MSTPKKITQTPKKTPLKASSIVEEEQPVLKTPSKTPSKPQATPKKTPAKTEDEDSVVLDSVPITPKKTPLKASEEIKSPAAKPTPKSATKLRTPISTPKKVPFADSSDSESDSSDDEEKAAATETKEKILKKTSPSVGSTSGKRTPISAPKSIPFEDSSDSDSDDEDDHHDEPIAVRTEKLGTPPRKEVVSSVDVAAEPTAKVATPKKAGTPAKPSNLSLPTNVESSDDEDVPAKVKRTPISTPKKVPYADSSDSESDEDDDEDVKMTEASETTSAKPITPKKASPASVAGKRTPINAPKSIPFEDSSDSDSDDEDDHHDEPIAVRTEKLGTPPRKEVVSLPFELDEEEKLEDEEHDLEVMKLSELEEKKRKHDKVESSTDSTEPENKKKKYQHAQKVGISEKFLLESLQKAYPTIKFAEVQAKNVYFHTFFETQRERSEFGNVLGKEKDSFFPFNEERRKQKEAKKKEKAEKAEKAAAAASTEGSSDKPKSDKPKKNNNKRKDIKAKKNNNKKNNKFDKKKNDSKPVKQEVKPEAKQEVKQEVKHEVKQEVKKEATTITRPPGLKMKKAADALKK